MPYIALLSDPAPLAQAAVYMGGILASCLLLTRPQEWICVRESARDVWARRGSK